jgi:hypothetical protein
MADETKMEEREGGYKRLFLFQGGYYARSGANTGVLFTEPTGSCRARFSGNISH